jgi:putative heme-binding domain-containing protein
VSSDHPDFHPTDVLQAADGRILVIDTGGWYKLCCPTSQLAKPQVPGAIYRLRKTGGEVALNCPPPKWEWPKPADFSALCAHLKSENQHVRRRAIEEIGQWPRSRTTPAEQASIARELVAVLLNAAKAGTADRFVEHALIYALIEGGDSKTMRDELPRTHPIGQRMLLYALCQTDPAAVDPRTIGGLLPAADDSVLEALRFCFTMVPEWKSAAQEWLSQNLAAQTEDVMTRLISGLSGADSSLLPDLGGLLKAAKEPALRLKLISAMQPVVKREDWPSAWSRLLLELLRSASPKEARAAADVLASCRLGKQPDLRKSLTEFCEDPAAGKELRLLVIANPELAAVAANHLPLLLKAFTTANSPVVRMQVAEIISRTTPDATALAELAGEIGRAGLLERALLLRAFRQCADGGIGTKVIDQLSSSGALASVPQHVLEECLGKFPPEILDRVKLARQKGAPNQEEQLRRLNELEKSLSTGDAQRGSVVFHAAKASCILCHKICYKGGALGPDLSKIGAVRTRRDLLEAVVFPSASFVRSYESVDVEHKDGSRNYGVIRNQSAETITLGTGAATPEVQIRLSDVKSMQAGQFSLMPAGLDVILAPQELADLIAFLQSLK